MSQRRTRKSILPDLIFSKFFLIAFVIVFIIVLFALAKGTVKNHQVKGEISDLQADINRYETENQEFIQLVEYLQTDTYIEQEAKLTMGYKKEGEYLVIIPQAEFNSDDQDVEVQIDKSNPAKWWAYFFKR